MQYRYQLLVEVIATVTWFLMGATSTLHGAPQQPSSLWVQPQSGWLYITDTNSGNSTGRVYVIDPAEGKVRSWIDAGYMPSAVVSPDGKRLYIVSGGSMSGVSVIDTATGKALGHVSIGDLLIYPGLPAHPTIALSPDGTRLYVERLQIQAAGVDVYTIATIDTSSLGRLPQDIEIPGCGPGRLLVGGTGRWDLEVMCAQGRYVKAVILDRTNGSERGSKIVDIPDGHRNVGFARPEDRIGYAVLGAQLEWPLLVRGDGAVLRVGATPAWEPLSTAGAYSVPPLLWAATPDASTLFVGTMDAGQITVTAVDHLIMLSGNAVVRKIHTTVPVWSLTLNNSGTVLYGVSPSAHAVSVINARNGTEERVINGIGTTPVFSIVAP